MTRSSSRFLLLVLLLGIILAATIVPAAAPARASFSSTPARLAGLITNQGQLRLLVTFPSESLLRVLNDQQSVVLEFDQVAEPLGVALAPGKVLLGSGEDGSVQVFDLKGRPVGQLGSGSGEFGRPAGIAVSPIDGRIYVADPERRELRSFDPVTGQPLVTIGAGVLKMPSGVGVAQDGMIFVADLVDGRVLRFAADGSYLGRLTSYGSNPGQTVRPIGVTFDASGRIYVTDSFLDAVMVYGTDFRFITSIGGFGTGPGKMRNPLDAWVHPVTGLVYATEMGDRELEVFPAIP